MGESKSPALPLGDGALNLAKSRHPLTKTYCFSSNYRRAGNNRRRKECSTSLVRCGAADESRTRNNLLGGQVLYQLNYSCIEYLISKNFLSVCEVERKIKIVRSFMEPTNQIYRKDPLCSINLSE